MLGLPLPESVRTPLHGGLRLLRYAQTTCCRHYAEAFSAARCLIADKSEFLKRPVDERLGVELQPVFEDRSVDATEVDVGHQVTL